jgi:deoxyribodipyrimidine photo-lyase
VYEPMIGVRDRRVISELQKDGVTVRLSNASLLHEPETVKTKSDKPYMVFTPFWRACLSMDEPHEPFPAPRALPHPKTWPRGDSLESLRLLPEVDWAGGIRQTWEPGERGAARLLERFLTESITDYESGRDRPDLTGTSRLSPYLHHGEISPRQVWRAVTNRTQWTRRSGISIQVTAFLRQLYWREFACHLLYHFPRIASQPLRAEFERLEWISDPTALKAWQQGRTGYPIVDAAMRELWRTGWLHNRLRMVVASFLTKDLLIDWREGARWFWDTLVDADLANNTFGWQWTAGCGADSAPFFRIFNPVTQGEKFDPQGRYARRWLPELAELPDPFIHKPWEAPVDATRKARASQRQTYPPRIVDHKLARYRALNAFQRIRLKKRYRR